MTPLARLVARTVSRSALGTDVVLTLGDRTVRTRGTWTVTDDDRTFLTADRTVSDSILRIPANELPSEPKPGDPITVAGADQFVAQAWRRNSVFLVEVTKRRPR